MEGENCRCTIFYLRRSSIHNTSSSPSLLPSAFHSRRILFSPLGSQAFGDIRGGNWVDIGNESEEQITGGGLENDEREREEGGASSQRGITAFVQRMAREHFPEETRNTISRWILEPTPSATPPHVLEEDPRSGSSTSVDVRFLLLLEEGRKGGKLLRGRRRSIEGVKHYWFDLNGRGGFAVRVCWLDSGV